MGYWSFYFLAKLGLYMAGFIGFHWLLNVAFALALAVPLPVAAWRRWRHLLAAPVAIALLWHDSFWPPFFRVIESWSALSHFSGAYLVELLGRVVSWQIVGALLLGGAAYLLIMRRVRLGVVAVVAMLAVPLLPVPGVPDAPIRVATAEASANRASSDDGPPSAAQLDAALQRFYDAEMSKSVVLPETRGEPPFDLIFLSVCSLGWDDMQTAGLDESLLMRRFDVVFRQFNSAASYSGPAVLRLLHAGCGQVPQRALYEPTSDRCYLFQRLTSAGWRGNLLLNHDGRFDGFANLLRQQSTGGMRLADNRSASVAMRSFDNTPIYSDYEVLSRWWEQTVGSRSGDRRSRAAPFALMYNTISLHDGNHLPGVASTDSLQTWKPRAQKLFKDFETFFQLVERSGRPTVIVLVPEHGASLRGDAVQIRGLRENPTPRITHVPAGLALFNMGTKPAGQGTIQVQQVTSYASMMAMVSALLQTGGTPWSRLARMAEVLPPMEWVAENGGTVMMRRGSRLYLRESEANWVSYPTSTSR